MITTSISPTAQIAATYATNRYASDTDPALAEARESVTPPPQTLDEPETERPVEEVTSTQSDKLSTTTADALRSRNQTSEIGGGAAFDDMLDGSGAVQEAAAFAATPAATSSESSPQGATGGQENEVQAQPATWARNSPYSGVAAGQGSSSAESGLPINLVA